MRATTKIEILESLGKNLPGVVFYRFIRKLGGDLVCDYISENIINITGHSAEEIIKNPALLKAMVHPQYIPYIVINTEESFKNHCNFEVEIECNSINAGNRWMKIVCIPNKLENGDVIWFGIQTDITNEKVMTVKLSKSNHELKLLNNINDILTTIDDEQAVYDLICNCLITKGGYKLAWIGHQPLPDKKSQIIKPISAFGDIEYLDTVDIDLNNPLMREGPTATVIFNGGTFINNDVETNVKFKPWLEAAQQFDIRSSLVLEIEIFKDRRSVLNIYSSKKDAFDENEVAILERIARGISSTVRNIHIEIEKQATTQQLNTSEANLRSIFDHTDIGYMLLDLKFKIISFNQSIYSIYKYQNNIELKVGGNFIEQIGGIKSVLFSEAFQQVIASETIMEYESKYQIDGIDSYYNVTIIPVKNNNEIIGICISKFDITKRKNEEIIRDKVAEELLQRNRDLEQFAYIISHNLRAPVANILGLNLLLNDEPGEHEKNEIINKINSSANRLDEVIKDLNTILQVRREVSEIKTNIDLTQLIENVKESISSIILNNKVEINVNFKQANTITSIRTYLGSVFFNLITNSIKYAKKNEPVRISIKSEKQDNSIIFIYKDNGIGIDMPKYGEQIFGLYKKFNMNVEGKGIGLYMVKTQVEVMGGSIKVKSELNVGTEFTITLPA